MEGACPRRKGRFQVHREFECSRIEQAVLAAAYRSILPEHRLSLAEGNSDSVDRCPNAGPLASHEHADSILHYVSAIGGQ
jgi:hypothetical protein